jgi:cellulose synthase/poly-beta-1,6-N-acetylglucosamine synthase-like glycosyltransferase
MSPYQSVLVATFWIASGLVVYAYAVYPAIIWGLARAFGRRPEPPEIADAELPHVSLVISAYNEAEVLSDRLRNAVAMDYPRDRLQILVGSDGSKDDTAEIARGFETKGVEALDFKQNRGKASVLNDLIARASGDIVLLSDANTDIDPDAARKLVRWFRDPEVGAVCGRLVLIDHVTGQNADGLYWKYETFLKLCEAKLGALLGANGAIYAIRKDLYVPIHPGTIVDDFVNPLLIQQKSKHKIIYDREAVAIEETAPDVGAEFHRRARIGAGGFQSIGMLWRLLNPARGWVAFSFLSHKILRWFCPFFLLISFAANLWLAIQGSAFYQVLLGLQVAFYALSVLPSMLPERVSVPKIARLATLFTSMNAALLVGFYRWLFGRQRGAWRRTSRLAKPSPTGVS